jgi:hypothetical protein
MTEFPALPGCSGGCLAATDTAKTRTPDLTRVLFAVRENTPLLVPSPSPDDEKTVVRGGE